MNHEHQSARKNQTEHKNSTVLDLFVDRTFADGFEAMLAYNRGQRTAVSSYEANQIMNRIDGVWRELVNTEVQVSGGFLRSEQQDTGGSTEARLRNETVSFRGAIPVVDPTIFSSEDENHGYKMAAMFSRLEQNTTATGFESRQVYYFLDTAADLEYLEALEAMSIASASELVEFYFPDIYTSLELLRTRDDDKNLAAHFARLADCVVNLPAYVRQRCEREDDRPQILRLLKQAIDVCAEHAGEFDQEAPYLVEVDGQSWVGKQTTTPVQKLMLSNLSKLTWSQAIDGSPEELRLHLQHALLRPSRQSTDQSSGPAASIQVATYVGNIKNTSSIRELILS